MQTIWPFFVQNYQPGHCVLVCTNKDTICVGGLDLAILQHKELFSHIVLITEGSLYKVSYVTLEALNVKAWAIITIFNSVPLWVVFIFIYYQFHIIL